jgi:hypothetical protein
MKEKIHNLLAELPLTEKINILESICNSYRKQNSIKLSSIKYIKSLSNGRAESSNTGRC